MTPVTIDRDRCNECGRCARVCPGHVLRVVEKRTVTAPEWGRGCIRCGQCVAACPEDALAVEGLDRELFEPLLDRQLGFDDFAAFAARRRSVRAYADRPVEREVVERALALGALAPVSFPPWKIEVTTILGREQVRAVADRVAVALDRMVAMSRGRISRFFMRRAVGKERFRFMDGFFFPMLADGLELFHREGIDVVLRGAPALMTFHAPAGTFEADVDGVLAAAHTALALQSLGLGVCFNGLVTGAVELDRTVNRALGVPEDHDVHAAFTFGYPRVAYAKSIRRAFAATKFVG
jgi:NAD-dependent dihydropyrimidine dehydrogenase PreA subunit/nitroreductase